ncbi:hypothetical protein [Streptomyces sp. NPDC053720]|uniref:hypothetical protein n=1 Tax=Streptomyces sp. NPDC053720 TaxID=3154855 RepID=UPI00344021F2
MLPPSTQDEERCHTTLLPTLGAHEVTELSYRAELLTSEPTTGSVRHTEAPAAARLQ